MFEIRMPQVNNNDETGILKSWLVEDGGRVDADTVLAVIETSKASYDLVSEREGVFHRLVEEDDEKDVGALIAYVFTSEVDRQAFLAQGGSPAEPKAAEAPAATLVLTKGAREAMAELGVGEKRLAALGKKVIKRSDVEGLAAAAPAAAEEHADTLELSRRQLAIAHVVSRSHRDVPRAFSAIRLHCDEALAGLGRLAEEKDIRAGLPELLVHALGELRERFPFFYGEVTGKRFRPAPADVGVTVDVGTGLFIPVVRAAGEKSLEEIADVLMDFRIKALRDDFHEEELRNGALTLSLNNEEDVLLVEPLILPGQSCMVTLAGLRGELARDEGGEIVERQVASLGLAYDHRVINGAEAIAFLRAIGESLAAPLVAALGAEEAPA